MDHHHHHHHTSNTTSWQPTSPVSTPKVPTESIWITQTQYSNRAKYVDPLFETSALAVKCERVFHATVNDILEEPLSEPQKKRCLEWYNNKMEAFAAGILYEVRQAEYLGKHGPTEATNKSSGDMANANPQPMPSTTYISPTESNEERCKRKEKEKEMLIQILGQEKASELRRKWKKEKHETKKRKKRAAELAGAD